MDQHTYSADVVEVTIKGAFATQHEFWAGEKCLGELKLKFGKLQGEFEGHQGERYAVEQLSFWKRDFVIRDDEKILGRANPPKNFSPRLVIEFEGEGYECSPVGFWARKWVLKDILGEVLMVMEPRGMFKRGAYLQIYKSIPLGLLVFFYTLVNKRWQEQSATSTAAAA
ncbi:MAG: hypothetical protein R6U57_03130 [Anaerolineales bacterium]